MGSYASRTVGLILLAACAAVAIFALAQEADAGTFWAAGLPTPHSNGPMQPSTVFSATNANFGAAAAGTVTLEKAGVAPAGALSVNPGDTGDWTVGEFYHGTQISPVATYTVTTPDPAWEVMQTTAVQGTSATTDATHLLELSKLGKFYNIATYQDPVIWLNPSPTYFTVIATKASTTITVTVAARTSGSLIPPPAPNGVPPMNPGPTYTYPNLGMGDALHIESYEGDPKCTAWPFISPPSPFGCAYSDITGSTVTCSTVCAVFAGAYCVSFTAYGGGSCDTINDQMLPDTLTGKVYVVCAAAMSDTGQLDMLRIRAAGGVANVNFAVASTAGVTMAAVTSTMWSSFMFNKDTVVTSDAPIHVVQYLAVSDVDRPVNPTADPVSVVQAVSWYGDPAMVELTAIDRSVQGHTFYANPSWENHLYVGAPTGAVLSLVVNNGAPGALPGLARPIGGSGYTCLTPRLGGITGFTGGTYLLNADVPITAQVLGLGYQTAYFYDTGGANPIIVPPPIAPGAGFKWLPVPSCVGVAVQFSDGSVKGDGNIVSWFWDFGDGATSTDQSPVHTYPAAGDYTVSLTIVDDLGFSDTFTQGIQVPAGELCILPTIPEDNSAAPRPPHDGVDASIADADVDKDGTPNATDNCPTTSNADQLDSDLDKAGDLCDLDLDGDGVANAGDNCVVFVNGAQLDADGDGQGNLCDDDIDGDAIENATDNCPMEANPTQDDANSDGIGDVCESSIFVSPNGGAQASDGVEAAGSNLEVPATSGMAWATILVSAIVAAALIVVLLVVVMRRKA